MGRARGGLRPEAMQQESAGGELYLGQWIPLMFSGSVLRTPVISCQSLCRSLAECQEHARLRPALAYGLVGGHTDPLRQPGGCMPL